MPVHIRPQGPVQLVRQQQPGGPVVPSPSRQGVIQHTVGYPQQQRYPVPAVRAMPGDMGSGHQWRPVHTMQQMSDPITGASRMIRPPGASYMQHQAAMQQQLVHPMHHHHQQQPQQHGGPGIMMPVQAPPGNGTPSGGPMQAAVPQAARPGVSDQQIVYNVEYLFEEDGKEVRRMPIEMNGQTIWVECVEPSKQGGVCGDGVGNGGLYKPQDSIVMELNGESDGKSGWI